MVAAKMCSMYDASSKHLYLLSLILARLMEQEMIY